jgi:hypothetical protein
MTAKLKRRTGGTSGTSGECVFAPTAGDLSSTPALVEFLTCEEWEPGVRRQTGTALIFLDGGTLKACLSDRDQGLVSFVALSSLSGLAKALEARLCDEKGDWRASKGGPARRPGR